MAHSENIGDDFVEYFIFELDKLESETNTLDNLLHRIDSIVKKCSEGYMWHLDEFKLIKKFSEYNITDEENLPPHLYGILHYGENIEDEWFLVYLLLQISKEISSICVRVVDSDGEFLLIEAADYLPNWAKPETCNKRVYIYQGEIHLIKPDNKNPTLDINQAIKIISTNPQNTKASSQIQNAILQRISKYPNQISELLHRTVVFVPVGVAAVLKTQPNLITHAIHSFCNRDSVDLKTCRAMKFFPPENCVYVKITLTKFLYAMLINSKYVPDKKTGWKLPPINSNDYKRYLLGIKIACGFEILASQAKQDTGLDNDKFWHTFINSLSKKGYFRGALEHSQPYDNLLKRAEEYYRSFKNLISASSEIGSKVLQIVKNSEFTAEDFHLKVEDFQEDSESWLEIDPKELDNMMEEKYGTKLNGSSDDVSIKIKSFLNHVSDLEGAEFPEKPTPPPRGLKKSKGKGKVTFEGDSENNKVNFDANLFSCAVQNMLDLVIPEDNWDLESDSDMSTYADEDDIDLEQTASFKSKMKEYMTMMDKELAGTTVGQSFLKKSGHKEDEETDFDNVEDFSPVDIDLNALKNILESYQAQMGDAGPVSNMLGPMGVSLDKLSKEKKSSD